jgi:hypothetical protein
VEDVTPFVTGFSGIQFSTINNPGGPDQYNKYQQARKGGIQ